MSVRSHGGAALLLANVACAGQAFALTFPLETGQTAVGQVETHVTREEDTLPQIARSYDLGFTELVIANPGIDPWVPGGGKTVIIPGLFLLPAVPHRGIVISLLQQRLYYFSRDGESVQTYPIGVGAEGHSTPLGVTRVTAKRTRPTWYPPPSIRAEDPELPGMVPPGPNNPMGDYALYLGWPRYTIHGTNKPFGIGRNSGHGCLRLYPEDIEQLFKSVPAGTSVRVINEETEWAWIGSELYLAAYPTKAQAEEINIGHSVAPLPVEGLRDRLAEAAGDQAMRIDWDLVDQISRDRNGIPRLITMPAASFQAP